MGSIVQFGSDGSSLTPRQAKRLNQAQHRAEVSVFNHGLQAAISAEYDRQDGQAAADAIRSALDEELSLLDYGLLRANGSVAKVELAARKVQLLSAINDRRISRRWG